MHRADPPAPGASPDDLEKRGDELRTDKNYLDAIDYYQAALKGAPGSASVFNKIGICQLMMHRYKEAKKSFERAIKADRKHADAYNNLGVIEYQARSYNAAIRHYQKAILLRDDAASYYSNMGAAYFGKKTVRQSHAKLFQGDGARSRHFRAHLARRSSGPASFSRRPRPLRLCSRQAVRQTGEPDRSLHYLKKAMEEGYKNIKDVYKDNEFSTLRKDPRFAELMAAKTSGHSRLDRRYFAAWE